RSWGPLKLIVDQQVLRGATSAFADCGQRGADASEAKGHTPAVSNQQSSYYSITSSARESITGDTSRPIAFAVFILIINSNLVGCSTGRSPGPLLPLRILSMKAPARRNMVALFGP